MIYAMTIICGLSGAPCIAATVADSPFQTVEACEAAHRDRRPLIATQAAQIAAAWGQRVRVIEACDTLERIRRVVPDAFPGQSPEAEA